jgi:hypothetical protein
MEKFLRDEDSSTLFISALGSLRGIRGLSQSRLSAVLRGRGLEHEAYTGLNKLMTELERLRDAVRPIPVRFHHAGVINALLNKIANEKLLVVCDDVDEPIAAQQ